MSPERVSRVAAVGAVAVFGLFGALFAGGEALSEPGGWAGIGLVLCWAVPMAALAAVALLRSERAAPVLLAALGVVAILLLVDVATGVFDGHGPVTTIAVFAVAVPSGLLGAHRAAAAGRLVLVAAGLQLLGAVSRGVGRSAGGPPWGRALGGSTGVVLVPLLLCAALLLLTSVLERTHHAPRPHAWR